MKFSKLKDATKAKKVILISLVVAGVLAVSSIIVAQVAIFVGEKKYDYVDNFGFQRNFKALTGKLLDSYQNGSAEKFREVSRETFAKETQIEKPKDGRIAEARLDEQGRIVIDGKGVESAVEKLRSAKGFELDALTSKKLARAVEEVIGKYSAGSESVKELVSRLNDLEKFVLLQTAQLIKFEVPAEAQKEAGQVFTSYLEASAVNTAKKGQTPLIYIPTVIDNITGAIVADANERYSDQGEVVSAVKSSLSKFAQANEITRKGLLQGGAQTDARTLFVNAVQEVNDPHRQWNDFYAEAKEDIAQREGKEVKDLTEQELQEASKDATKRVLAESRRLTEETAECIGQEAVNVSY